ncbi:MAG: DUF4855 domain-containing protein [Phycisphaerae bacterium]|nr:DUF4855 domain-containing protein [Phycisphaerae bacterium]
MHVLLMAILAAIVAMGASPEGSAYQQGGTSEVAGVRHLCLIYHGRKIYPDWTPEAIMPYVAHVDEQGKPTDWFFDSFLFIEFACDNGAMLHHYSEGRVQATAADWAWLADAWFRDRTGLAGMDGAIEQAGRMLNDPDHQVNIVIALPIPLRPITAFGPLPGCSETLEFSKDSDRLAAVAWYMDRVLGRWRKAGYRHLRLVGFYWTAESIPPRDNAIVEAVAKRVHELGYKLFWIPYFSAQGVSEWRKRGIDAMMLQPNYFFPAKVESDRLAKAAGKAQAAGCGIEIEFDARAFESKEREDRFWAYLDAGVEYGWMKNAVLGYYGSSNMVKRFAENPGAGREMYEALYRFVKGTYEPSGRTQLPEPTTAPCPVPPERDGRANLALASRGAKISGCVPSATKPELAPEQIIDGVIDGYGGQGGFGYFKIPGSLTVKLAEVATVARTHVLLWDIDDRSFQYRVETSLDGEHWELAADKSRDRWRSWQVDRFTPRKARYVRLTGLHNSINNNCQVVEFEVYPPK